MTNRKPSQQEPSADAPDDLDRALTTAADVESAGRSCVVIIAMVLVIVALLGVWIVYTAT